MLSVIRRMNLINLEISSIIYFSLTSAKDMQKCVDTLCQNVVESIVQERCEK